MFLKIQIKEYAGWKQIESKMASTRTLLAGALNFQGLATKYGEIFRELEKNSY